MKGWLFYDAQGAQKNQWYIDRLRAEAKGFGGELKLKIYDRNADFSDFEKYGLPDFAIVRTICPKLNAQLEKRGVRTFNNAKTSAIANDKYQTYLACKEWGIPVLPTVLFKKGGGQVCDYPCVMKSTDGHGGSEVYWVENETQAIENVQEKKTYILQRPNEIIGEDRRVYAIGGEIVASVARRAKSGFKSNFSLGGEVFAVQADETQKAIVKTVYEKLRFDYIGIDFLPSSNGSGWVLNEIEDSAGARMLYACTDIDIASLFMRHVGEELQTYRLTRVKGQRPLRGF